MNVNCADAAVDDLGLVGEARPPPVPERAPHGPCATAGRRSASTSTLSCALVRLPMQTRRPRSARRIVLLATNTPRPTRTSPKRSTSGLTNESLTTTGSGELTGSPPPCATATPPPTATSPPAKAVPIHLARMLQTPSSNVHATNLGTYPAEIAEAIGSYVCASSSRAARATSARRCAACSRADGAEVVGLDLLPSPYTTAGRLDRRPRARPARARGRRRRPARRDAAQAARRLAPAPGRSSTPTSPGR